MLALVKLRRIWWFEVFFNILSWNNCVRGAPSHQDSSSGNQKYLSKIEWESNSCGHKSANWQPLTKKKKKIRPKTTGYSEFFLAHLLFFDFGLVTVQVFKFLNVSFYRWKSRSSALPIRTALKQTVSWGILSRETQRYRLVPTFTCSSWHSAVVHQMWDMFWLFFKSDYILHHPEHCGYDPRHHRDRHWPAAPNVSTAATAASCSAMAYVLHM